MPLNKTIQLYKEAYSNHPKELWVLVILTFINRMGTMVIPFLAVYLNTVLDFSLKEAGFLVSAFGIGSLGGSYFGGKFTERKGPEVVIFMSLFLAGILFIFLQFFTSFWGLFIMIFFTALLGEAYRPAVSTAIGKYVRQDARGRSMAMIRLAICLGMSAGPILAGFIASTRGYNLLFWIDGITCIFAAGYFYFQSKQWEGRIAIKKSIQSSIKKGIPVKKNAKYLWFLLSTFLFGFAFIQWFHTIPVFIKTEWFYDEKYIGLLLGLSSLLIVFFEMPLIHAVETKKVKTKSMYLGLFLVSISYLFFLFPQALIICFLAITIWTIGEMFFLPLNSAIPLYMGHNDRHGSYMAGYWMTWSSTNILAPLIGFHYVDKFGYESFWLILFVLTIISLLITYSLKNNLYSQEIQH